MNSSFYVYAHLKPDLTPFYIGKGTGGRAYSLRAAGRNAWHRNIVSKYGEENIVVEVMGCASEKEAFFREIMIISALKDSGVALCNITKGGSGGMTSSSEHLSAKGKARFSSASVRKVHSEKMQAVAQRPDFSNNVSKGTTNALRGASRDAHLAGLKRANASQTTEQRSLAQLKSFETNPERRKVHSEAARLVQQNFTEEQKVSRSDKLISANLNSWANPEVRARRIAGMKGKKHVRKSSKGT